MTFDQDARTSQDGIQNKAISRREVLKLFVGAGAAAAVTASLSLRPFTALATTQSEIDAAQSKYDEAERAVGAGFIDAKRNERNQQ